MIYQGVIPGWLRKRWRWVHVGWVVFRGDRFLFAGESYKEKRGFMPVETDQVGTKVERHYQHRFIRRKSVRPTTKQGGGK